MQEGKAFPSALRQWPVQLHLLSPAAPYFQEAELLIAADCVPFAYAGFHTDLLYGRALAVGCPKLDVVEPYVGKIAEIVDRNNIKKIVCAVMEVPCCYGMVQIVREALSISERDVPLEVVVVSVKGEVLERSTIG